MQTTEKTCFKCGLSKPLSEFYRHAMMADGHLNKCKQCTKTDVGNHRHGAGRERVLAYDRERAKTNHRKAARDRTVKEWSVKHPDRKRAQAKLRRAVLSGAVDKLPCIIFGEKAEAHHPHYDLPLDVVWLCPSHHKQAHVAARESNQR